MKSKNNRKKIQRRQNNFLVSFLAFSEILFAFRGILFIFRKISFAFGERLNKLLSTESQSLLKFKNRKIYFFFTNLNELNLIFGLQLLIRSCIAIEIGQNSHVSNHFNPCIVEFDSFDDGPIIP